MNIYSWNINGIRSITKSGLLQNFLRTEFPDILCLLETRISIDQLMIEIRPEILFSDYFTYWNSSYKKGYSGVGIISKYRPLNFFYGFNYDHNYQNDSFDDGRVITLEFNDLFLVSVYSPNSGHDLSRLSYKLAFEKKLLKYVRKLKKIKNLIIAGDFNVAYSILDIYDPFICTESSSGFTLEERISFGKFLQCGMVDSFRKFHPDKTYFSYWTENVDLGFNLSNKFYSKRINYFLINDNKLILDSLKESTVIFNYVGTDHPPIKLSFSPKIKYLNLI